MQWQEFRSQIRHLSARDTGRVEKAFQLGKKMHDGQKRRSGEPYFSHPIAVAHMLSDLGGDADTIIAALLHDTVEDTPLTLPEIDEQFNGAVATLIDGVTKLNSDDIPISPKLDEQIETLRKIFTLMEQDIRIMVIKLVDRLHNMQTIEFLAPERQQTMAKETLEFFVKIADKLCMQDIRDELEALCLSVLDPELLRTLIDIRMQNEQRGNVVIEDMRNKIRSQDSMLSSRTGMLFEYKTWNQLKTQLSTGSSVATGVTSQTIAFVCDDVDSCYRTLGTLHQLWKREAMSFQDFINAPQLNGYQGIHTTIISQDGTRVRCKIRTREMQQYARRGVTTVCFKGRSTITDILPWTKRISELTTDTEGSSKNFWQNLQSDILGESIVIHGPDDATVQLPRDATALDGVFYLLQDNALSVESIRVNGTEVPFNGKLNHADSLDATLATEQTCTLEWLRSVQTGFAAAKIRMALAEQSHERKLTIGRDMLQRTFTEHKQGFIEEFEEEILQKRLQSLGHSSLHDIFIAIADGRLDPAEIYSGLFERPKQRQQKTPTFIVRYDVNMDDIDMMDRMNLLHRKYGHSLSDIRYHRAASGNATVSLSVHIPSQDLEKFQQELLLAGAKHLTAVRQSAGLAALVATIILLWGLDPVFAHSLLKRTSITPVDLTLVRFFTFFIASSATYALHQFFSRVKAKSIGPWKPSLILSAAALFSTAILSYMALQQLSPGQYILFIIAGLVITEILRQDADRSLVRSVFSLIALVSAIFIMLLSKTIPTTSILAGIGSAIGFALYSECSRRYLETEARIHARYPAFVLWLSILALPFCIGLLPSASGLLSLGWQTTALSVLFAFVFTFLPYVLYFECMRKTNIDILNRLLPFVSIIAIVGDLALNRTTIPLAAAGCIALFLYLHRTKLPVQE